MTVLLSVHSRAAFSSSIVKLICPRELSTDIEASETHSTSAKYDLKSSAIVISFSKSSLFDVIKFIPTGNPHQILLALTHTVYHFLFSSLFR